MRRQIALMFSNTKSFPYSMTNLKSTRRFKISSPENIHKRGQCSELNFNPRLARANRVFIKCFQGRYYLSLFKTRYRFALPFPTMHIAKNHLSCTKNNLALRISHGYSLTFCKCKCRNDFTPSIRNIFEIIQITNAFLTIF